MADQDLSEMVEKTIEKYREGFLEAEDPSELVGAEDFISYAKISVLLDLEDKGDIDLDN